jgi:hypothetical protein
VPCLSMGSSIIPQKPTYAMIVHRVECHAWVIIRLGHHGLNIPRDIPAEKTKHCRRVYETFMQTRSLNL